jgi:hypothetical protein
MPLVRISHMKGKSEGFGKRIGEVVYRTMVETINVPANDNFQLTTEHDSNTLIYDPSYLSIPRTDGIVIVQITLCPASRAGRHPPPAGHLRPAGVCGRRRAYGLRGEL